METTGDDQEPDMALMVLELIGGMSRVQEQIDQLIAKRFFDTRMKNSAKFLYDKTVDRIKDEDRPTLFMAIALDLGTDADLYTFKHSYTDLRKYRNDLAHSVSVTRDGLNRLTVLKTLMTQPDPNKAVWMDITRKQLTDKRRVCAWLEAQIRYVALSSDLYSAVYQGDTLMRVVKPTRKAADWDGVVMVPDLT